MAVSTLVSTNPAVPAGDLACFTQCFTHDCHAVGMRDPAEVRSQVRAAGTHSASVLGSSQLRFATPIARTVRCYCCEFQAKLDSR